MCTHQTDCLLFQVLRLAFDDLSLLVDNRLRLIRSGNFPHLAEGVHIERHIVHLAFIIGHRTIGVTVELYQVVDKFPYFFIAGVENVSTIFMHVDSFHFLTCNIAADMISFFQYQTGFSFLFCKISKYSGKQAASYQ